MQPEGSSSRPGTAMRDRVRIPMVSVAAESMRAHTSSVGKDELAVSTLLHLLPRSDSAFESPEVVFGDEDRNTWWDTSPPP